jgi:hypothetical protein
MLNERGSYIAFSIHLWNINRGCSLPDQIMHLGGSTSSSLVSADDLKVRILESPSSLQWRQDQTTELLEVTYQQDCDEIAVPRDIANARMAEVGVGDAEDDLIQEALVLIEHILAGVRDNSMLLE